MNYSIIDIETDGLIENVTKIHCVSVHKFQDGTDRKFTLINRDQIIDFFLNEETLVGHNIIRYDVPVLEKLLGIKIKAKLIDSLGLSWYLYPDRIKHGLEFWGEDLGVEKPKIADWNNLKVEDYIHRCETDVEINRRLFNLQGEYLFQLYDNDRARVDRLIGYLMFKLDCAREQEEVKWKLDIPTCEANLEFFKQELQSKINTLTEVMPKVTKYKDVARPKAIYKKVKPTKKNPNPEPELTVAGEKWLELLKEKGLPEYHLGTIRVPVSEEAGNPGSHAQLKNWLFSLGWIPETYKYVKEDDGTQRKIPQLSKEGEPEICDSVKKLYDKVPELDALEGLFVLRHRMGILEGFLQNHINGFLKAEVKGFTNTLRFQHTTIVNLPTIPKPYWEKVRGCLIAPDDDHVLCGSDMSGLEDNTKRHYMYYYDPEYVKEMQEYGFDAHCDIAVLAKKMSHDDQTFYKYYDKKKEGKDYQKILDIYYEKGYDVVKMMENSATGFTLEEMLSMTPEEQAKQIKVLKPIRLKNKKVNFAGVYGAGPPKIALTAGISLAEAKLLHTTYWKRNWSVKKIAENCTVKTIGSQMWLLNPVSQFWYSLRVEKDKFSTLNQGTGVYCFDSWVRNVRKQGIKNCGQFHDEIISPVKKGTEDEHRQKLKNAIDWTNQELQLNVTLGISIDFGENYSQIH